MGNDEQAEATDDTDTFLSGDTGELAARLESIAAEDDERSTVLTTAAERLRDQQETVEELQRELEETNEGMVALTLELQEAEQRYRSLFEEAAEGIYKTTPDAAQYVMVNQSMTDILGYDDPTDIENEITPAEVFVDPDRFATYQSSLRAEEELENFEYRIRRTDGEIRWVSDSVRLVADADDKRSYRGGVIDITERKNYENRLQERNEALEALNRVVRHDIRNDVQVISTWAETLEASVDADKRDALDRIRQKAESITNITRETGIVVETLTGEDERELEPVVLESTLVTEVERQQDANPNVSFEIPSSIPFVQVQANEMLGAVFRNLLSNAVSHNDATEPVVEVTCEAREADVLIRIADNGPGIDDDRKDAIFGKGVQSVDSDGTGIGLYIVNYLVTEYGGEVWVEDNDPTGAVFCVTLPKAE